jgi:hypothetical protein
MLRSMLEKVPGRTRRAMGLGPGIQRFLMGGILASLGVFLTLLVSPEGGWGQEGGFQELPGWLSGCWMREGGGSLYEEQWMEPRGRSMMGMVRTVQAGATISFEHLRIDGSTRRLRYIAVPSGQRLAEFQGLVSNDTLVVFENPSHDFPQRILYRRITGDSVVASIEGEENGVARGVDFPMARTGCPGGSR